MENSSPHSNAYIRPNSTGKYKNFSFTSSYFNSSDGLGPRYKQEKRENNYQTYGGYKLNCSPHSYDNRLSDSNGIG